MQIYRHRQIGYLVLIFMGTATAILIVLMATSGATALQTGVCAVLVLALLLFCTLTVEVTDEALSFRFGIGLIRKSIQLSEIESCAISSFPWYYGWGLRYTPEGWLYCISGLSSVKLILKSGKAIQVGTDQAKELCTAVTDALQNVQRKK